MVKTNDCCCKNKTVKQDNNKQKFTASSKYAKVNYTVNNNNNTI